MQEHRARVHRPVLAHHTAPEIHAVVESAPQSTQPHDTPTARRRGTGHSHARLSLQGTDARAFASAHQRRYWRHLLVTTAIDLGALS